MQLVEREGDREESDEVMTMTMTVRQTLGPIAHSSLTSHTALSPVSYPIYSAQPRLQVSVDAKPLRPTPDTDRHRATQAHPPHQQGHSGLVVWCYGDPTRRARLVGLSICYLTDSAGALIRECDGVSQFKEDTGHGHLVILLDVHAQADPLNLSEKLISAYPRLHGPTSAVRAIVSA